MGRCSGCSATTVGGVNSWDDASGPEFGSDRQGPPPLTMEERAGVLDDLAELEVFRTLLEPTGVKGIVVDCPDCEEEHHVDWALMQANLRQLLEEGQTGRHPSRARVRPHPIVGGGGAGAVFHLFGSYRGRRVSVR